MNDDAELLRRYAEEKSEAAFAELVERHLGLVYHAALRQCGGDAHRAQDVAQKVFADLAGKARPLSRRSGLTGWLYTSTRYAAAQAVRAEARRQAREQEVFRMNEVDAQHPALATDWATLRPVIDEALHSLGERDREAVLLRFFEGKGFAELGAELAVSEDGARMRVDRALEKLRARLARHGITSTAAALGLTLSQQAGAALPAGLATTVTGAAITSAAGGGSGAAAGWLIFMSTNKATVAALVAVAGVALLNLGQQRANAKLGDELDVLRGENARLAAARAERRNLAAATPVAIAPSAELTELTRLREQSAALRKQIGERMPKLPVSALAASRALSPNPSPSERLEALYGEGRSSPMRSWQTLRSLGRAHAFANSEANKSVNADMMALIICVDEPARAKVQAFIDALPPDRRAGFTTPERLLAPVFNEWLWRGEEAKSWSPTEQTYDANDPTRAYTAWEFTFASGRKETIRYGFKRFDDGWRYGPLSATDTEQMLAMLDPLTGLPLAKEPAR